MIWTGTAAQAGWIAYNDSAFKAGQVNGENVTTFGLGRSFAGEGSAGNLKNFTTGNDTGITVAYTEFFSTGSVNSAGDAATFVAGTDADALFNGMVDWAGNMSYGDSPGWHVDLTISGLDPNKRYTFAGTANRSGGSAYADRVTNWKLMGADAYTYASSPGAQKVANDSVEFSTGENGAGYVARWTDIRPGADGTIVIRTGHSVGQANGGIPGAHAYKGYAGGVFLVGEQEDDWEAYNDSAFKPGQVNAENATTFGLGRSFAGEGSSGKLKVFVGGAETSVTASYTEFFSTGSVNSAGDGASFVAGTDADRVFNGKVDLAGNMSYGDSPGWYVDLTFTGLDPTKKYSFVGTANRNGGSAYADRVTNWKLIGAESYTYASSAGAQKVANDSVEFSTGENGAGLVAGWTDINPGSDGKIVIRTSHSVGQANGGIPGAHAYKGYAGGVFLLKSGPYTWKAFNDSAFKAGQVNAENVTTFGLGRSFSGEGSEGKLKELAGGAETSVTAAYTEFFSTGSVNSAGDAADYPPGSDAEAVFKGIVDLSGNISYGDSPGWHVDLTFSGLNPAKRYTFVGTADRHGGAAYADRVTNWKLIGADSQTYASSAAAQKIANDSVEFSTGDNVAGLVARWTDINPGPDGTVVVRTSHSVGQANGGIAGAHSYKGYGGGVFLLAEQYAAGGGPAEKPIDIFSLTPADGITGASPNTPIVAVLKPGDHAVKPASVKLKLDGVAVTPLVTTDATGTVVSYTTGVTLASSSSHTAELSFTDDNTPAKPYVKAWTFQVLDYSAFPAIAEKLAVAFDAAKHKQRGFAIKIVAPDPNDGLPLATIEDAQAIFDQTFTDLVDPAIRNSLGYYLERTTINYQVDGQAKGNQANDRRFPGIAGSGQPGDQFALQAYALVRLSPGYYHWNITMQPGFKLFVGEGADEAELPFTFTPCTNCGGDDGPWYTDFLIGKEGLYPFRLLFFSRGGSSSLEWVDVAPTGLRHLINDEAPGALPSYIPPDALPQVASLSIKKQGADVVISWTGGGKLQSATDVNGTWAEVDGQTNPLTIRPGAARKFYRVAQ